MTTPQNSPGRAHLAFLDSLRAVAAVYVLFHHVHTISKDNLFEEGMPTALTYLSAFFSAGHLAVNLFIVLSGFSLMLAVLKREQVPPYGNFLKRRAWRILPPYYAALALPVLLHFVIMGRLLTPNDFSIRSIVSHLALIQDLFPDTYGSINNVLWSVSVEWRIYLLFPLFAYLYLKFGIRCLLAVSVVVFGGALATCKILGLEQVYNWTGICPQYVVLFAIGMTCAAVRFDTSGKYTRLQERLERFPWRWFWIAFVPLFGIYLWKSGLLWRVLGQSGLFAYDMVAGLFAGAVLLYASYTTSSRGLLNNTGLAKVGLMAYSIYLVHYPVLQLLANLLRDYAPSKGVALLLMATVGASTAYALSCVFYQFIERPFAVPKKQGEKK